MTFLFTFTVLLSTLLAILGETWGIRFSALGWALPCVLSILILIRKHHTSSKSMLLLWLPWLIFVMVSAAISPHENSVIRSIIIITPILVGLAAASFSYSEHSVRKLKRWLIAFILAAAVSIFLRIVLLRLTAADIRVAPETVLCAGIFSILIVHWRLFRSKQSLLMSLSILALPLIGANRGPLLACALTVIFGFPSLKLRKKIVLLGIVAVSAISALILLPELSEKMFVNASSPTSASISMDNVSSSGRFFAWELLSDGITEEPFFGHGANASEPFLVAAISPAFAHPHNDYLRLAYDYGIPIAVLYLILIFTQLRRLLKAARASSIPDNRFIMFAAASLYVPYIVLMFFDNPFLYAAYYGNLHFLLIGTSYSLWHKNEKPRLTSVRQIIPAFPMLHVKS